MDKNRELLLVDDDEGILENLENIAKKFGYASILMARTLDEAQKLMRIGQLVISDLGMGKGDDGLTLAREFKGQDGNIADFAIHSSSFTNNPGKDEIQLRKIFTDISDEIVIIPKLDRSVIDIFLDRE